MKITVLGSGGGEGYPAPFCGCDHCVTARAVGGKSIRTLPQTLINDDLLIDLPPDTSRHALENGLNLGDIPDLLITHTHADHFVPSVLEIRAGVFAHKLKCPNMNVYGSPDVRRVYYGAAAIYGFSRVTEATVNIHTLTAYQTAPVGKYTVTPLPARHALGTLVAFNYVIERDGQKLLYLHDTGMPTDQVIDFLANSVGRVDGVVMDATMGVADVADTCGHMSFAQNMRLVEILRTRGVADDKTTFVVNHITHNNAETHDKVEEIFAGTGIIVSYDGMKLEI